jgi:hypothetical protein
VRNILESVETTLVDKLFVANGCSLYFLLISVRLDPDYLSRLKPEFANLANIAECSIQQVYIHALSSYLNIPIDSIPSHLITKLDYLLINHIL